MNSPVRSTMGARFVVANPFFLVDVEAHRETPTVRAIEARLKSVAFFDVESVSITPCGHFVEISLDDLQFGPTFGPANITTYIDAFFIEAAIRALLPGVVDFALGNTVLLPVSHDAFRHVKRHAIETTSPGWNTGLKDFAALTVGLSRY